MYALLALVWLAACNASSQPLEQVASGFESPLGVTHAGDGSGRIFVLEQRGTIQIVRNGERVPAPFLDIRDRVRSGGEQGLLGLAFPPDFAASGVFYVCYSDRDGATVVSRFSTSDEPDAAPAGSEEVLLRQPQPYANHNGGHIAFGPDGYLYVSLGDGGGAGDPLNAGQDLGTWLGALLRIDVAPDEGYAVPPDNPFVDRNDALPEIWAWGLRNPWRFSFDRETGDLYIGDVGQNQYEEIDLERAGSPGGVNYGWSVMEGPECFRSDSCDREGLTPPILSYTHDSGWGGSVTGGFVYRGSRAASLRGRYVFGDYLSGRIFAAGRNAAGEWTADTLHETGWRISSFGEDEGGELYVVDHAGGGLYVLGE